MEYSEAIEQLLQLRDSYTEEGELFESLNTGISALKTLEDMGAEVNAYLQEHHVPPTKPQISFSHPAIFCFDYNTDGTRYLSEFKYSQDFTEDYRTVTEFAHLMRNIHDEVYITDIDVTNQAFNSTIVVEGCRIF